MNPPIDWTRQHTDLRYPRSCIAFVTVENGKFAQLWGAPGKPFTCWDANPVTVETSKPYARQERAPRNDGFIPRPRARGEGRRDAEP